MDKKQYNDLITYLRYRQKRQEGWNILIISTIFLSCGNVLLQLSTNIMGTFFGLVMIGVGIYFLYLLNSIKKGR